MKWLITGGCGFIGTRLIHRLRQQPDAAIRVLDDLSVGTRADLEAVAGVSEMTSDDAPPRAHGAVQLLAGDIRRLEDAERAACGMDVIVHLAANTGVIPSVENPLHDCECNVVGTLNMLEAARKHQVSRFVLASSGAPLGAQDPPVHEQKLPRPVSPYGASKLAAEAYCGVYHATFGVGTVCLRFGNVYGPGSKRKGSVVAKFIKQAVAGETLVIYGDGQQTRDFIYIDDLLDAIVLGAHVRAGGEVFQIASGGETTVNELSDELAELLRARGLEVRLHNAAARAGEVIRNYSDITKARTVLGWEPRHTLNEGLRKTVDWFLAPS